MKVEILKVGPLETNCYLLKKEDECIIIDPGEEAEKIKDAVGSFKVSTILVTHDHFDHIGALDELLKFYNVKKNHYSAVDNMEVINTPGHTYDSKTFYFPQEKVMFCGDFLFKDSFGRIDLGGNAQDMIKSLELIQLYDKNIVLYPGHGEHTILSEEIANFADYVAYLKKA